MVWVFTVKDPVKVSIHNGTPNKLFKYGQSTLNPAREYISITEAPEYADKLPFHPETFLPQIENKLAVKNIDRKFLELYEISTIFHLGAFRSNDKQIPKLNALTTDKTDTYVHWFSNKDIDEVALVPEILNNLHHIKSRGNAVFQMTGSQTKPMAQLIYYLASLCETAYIYRPSIISDIYDIKYIVLKDIKTVPKHSVSGPIDSLGIAIPIPIDNVIQCMNLTLMRRKIHMYEEIKEYLKTAIGSHKPQLLELQERNAQLWLDKFINPRKDLLETLLVTCPLTSVYDLEY